MGTSVIVLSNDYLPIGTVDWKKAVRLICSHKAEVVSESNFRLHECMFMPTIIKLIRTINRAWKVDVNWSRKNVFIRDDYKCAYCGKDLNFSSATIDHVIPVSLGGKNTWENTVCCCRYCNLYKGDIPLERLEGMELMFKPYKPKLIPFQKKKFEMEISHRKTLFEEYKKIFG